jgi:hypothetical protein
VALLEHAMTKEEFHEFMIEQEKEIERYKWLESEKAGYDLGQTIVYKWIELYAKSFYLKWRKEHERH